MSFELLPGILLIVAIVGIALIILRHLPQALEQEKHQDDYKALQNLSQKGLPAKAITRLSYTLRLWKKRIWNFLLETKDLKPQNLAGYKIKKIFGNHAAGAVRTQVAVPTTTVEVRNEQYFLSEIKKQPKNLTLYSDLGKYYMERGNLDDAKDVYQYLTQHDPGNSDHHSRLAQCFYKLRDFQKAVQSYDRSLKLDSTQPNRYYNKAVCLEAMGKNRDAAEALKRAIALESSNPRYYLALSACLARTGERNEAKVALLQAKKLDPKNKEVLEKLKTI